MRSNFLIWLGLLVSSGPSTAEPTAVSSVASYSTRSHVYVVTLRSDGAIFPAVVQSKRVQQKRRVRFSSSIQALPNRKMPAPHEENASGGEFVLAASSALTGVGGGNTFQVVVPIITFPTSTRQIVHQRKR